MSNEEIPYSIEELNKMPTMTRANLGHESWNKWAEANKGMKIDFSIAGYSIPSGKSFDYFIFPGDVSFEGMEISSASFQHVIFLGEVNFKNVNFLRGITCFKFAKFKGKVTNFSNAIFSETEIVFNGAEFNCEEVKFTKVKFKSVSVDFESVDFNNASVCFSDTKFEGGKALFAGAKFNNSEASFNSAVFDHHADFSAVIFEGTADFSSAVFKGPVILEMTNFSIIPDFRRTTLSAHFTFHKMFLAQSSPGDPSSADKLRRLKDLAIDAKDHDRELAFFADELRVKRPREKWGPRFISHTYEIFSDFGRSIVRPFIGLIVTWIIFGFGYFCLASNPPNSLIEGFTLSGATLVPFVAASRATMAETREALFYPEPSGWVNALAFLEGFIGIVFIFLIGLALRNRFRI